MEEKRLLLVDDEPQFLSLVALMLRGKGYRYFGAQSGPEALATASRESPHLILLDIMMPGMNGLEVCRRLRADPETAHIPILVVTAKTAPQDRIDALTAGADDFLSKPVDPVELRGRVEGLIAYGAQVRSQAVAAEPAHEEPSVGVKVVGFLGSKGGVGTSTVAANVAVALARGSGQSQQVVLATFHSDAGSLALQLGLRPDRGVETLASLPRDELNATTVQHHLTRHHSGVRMLGGLLRPAASLPSLDATQAEAVIHALGSVADYLLVDLGTGLGEVNRAVLRHLVYLLVVVEPQRIALVQAQALLASLDELGFGASRTGIVQVNKVPAAVSLTMEGLEIFLQRQVVSVVFAAPELVYHAAEQGIPIVLLRPEALICDQLRQLGRQIGAL